MSKIVLLLTVMFLWTSNIYAGSRNIEDSLKLAFQLKIKLELKQLDFDNNASNFQNVGCKIYDDMNFAFIYSKSIEALSIQNIYLSQQRMAFYFFRNRNIFFISGFEKLDLADFFEVINVIKMPMYLVNSKLSQELNIPIESCTVFFDLLQKFSRQTERVNEKIRKRYKIL